MYLDDIPVASGSVGEHEKVLTEVLRRLFRTGLQAKASKCEFFRESLELLGYCIDAIPIGDEC